MKAGEYRQYAIEEYHPHREPYYVPICDEIELFQAAFAQKIPVLLKGPTGCGKTRFVEYMAWKLGRPLTIVTRRGRRRGATREETTGAAAGHRRVPRRPDGVDLVGRYLLEGETTRGSTGR